jgi:hypothetical protein
LGLIRELASLTIFWFSSVIYRLGERWRVIHHDWVHGVLDSVRAWSPWLIGVYGIFLVPETFNKQLHFQSENTH